LSNRIIPKESLTGLRKAELGDLSGAKGSLHPAQAGPVPDASALARARQEGHRDGVEAGRREMQAQLQSERIALKELTAGLTRFAQDFEQGLANDVLSMSLELAKLVVRHSVKVKPDLVLSVVREAIASLPGVDQQTAIHLHPADAGLLRRVAESDSTLAQLPWKIVEDPQMERGGCRLETATTEVDASLETRWRRIIAALGRDDPWIDITT
jgi:flagellar assembly protein FliH